MRIIDMHCHPGTEEWFQASVAPFAEELKEYWSREFNGRSEDEVVADLERNGVEGILVAFDAETETGRPPCDNRYVAAMRDRHLERFPAVWGSVDPWKGEVAIREAERALKEDNVIGFHFHPVGGNFKVSNRRFYPLWETISSLGGSIMVDAGFTGMGAGMRGGGGRRLKNSRPFPILDDLAADFPDLTIVAAHPAWPFTEEMMAIALHKPNVYWEMSGWGPEYIPEPLKHDIKRRLQDKIMFGSDYPSISYERLISGWEKLELPDTIAHKVFHENAERIWPKHLLP